MSNTVISLMGQLKELTDLHPEFAKAALKEMPEANKLFEELSAQYNASDVVSTSGYALFYSKVYNRELPKLIYPVVSSLVDAFHNKKGVMFEGWRGVGKSTTLMSWAGYIVGARPYGSTVLIRINDAKAKEAGDTIAEMIETNPGWKDIFPHIIPDKEAGWSVERGFHVKDMRIVEKEGYDKWLQYCFADHGSEPSLICGGLTGGINIGMHPTNGMWFDDLHNENNTRSLAEMQRIVDIMSGDIIPTWTGAGGSPALGVACTPWNEEDVYVRMMKTGKFKKISIPVYVKEGQIPKNHPVTKIWEKNYKKHGAELFEPYNQKVILTWPEVFNMDKVMEMWESMGARFGQMALLDLTTLKGLTLQRKWIGEYKEEQIGENWPTYFGIDFASTTDKLRYGKTDYFALAIGKAIPNGGVLVTGGYVDRLPMHDCVAKVQALASLYNPVRIGVEKLGSGKQFIEQLVLKTRLPILPLPIAGQSILSKGVKFERFLSADFSMGKMWISSVQDAFLKKFIDEWISWDGGIKRSRTGHDDTLDAVYMLREAALGNITKMQNPGALISEKAEPSPFATAAMFYR